MILFNFIDSPDTYSLLMLLVKILREFKMMEKNQSYPLPLKTILLASQVQQKEKSLRVPMLATIKKDLVNKKKQTTITMPKLRWKSYVNLEWWLVSKFNSFTTTIKAIGKAEKFQVCDDSIEFA